MTRIYAAAALLLMALSFAAGWSWRGSRADAASSKTALSQSKAETVAEQAARKAEQAKAKQLESITAKYEQDKADAQDKQDAVAAGLAAGNLKLRHELGALYTAKLSSAATSAIELDAAAQRGAAITAAAIGVGAKCDAQAAGLQAVVKADRGE